MKASRCGIAECCSTNFTSLTDGGSFWGRPVDRDPKQASTYSFHGVLTTIPIYETLDVRFYGSMPLMKFWPEIEKEVMREFADTVPREWPREDGVDLEKRTGRDEPIPAHTKRERSSAA